jgi:hypothetical protein
MSRPTPIVADATRDRSGQPVFKTPAATPAFRAAELKAAEGAEFEFVDPQLDAFALHLRLKRSEARQAATIARLSLRLEYATRCPDIMSTTAAVKVEALHLHQSN